MVKKLMILGAAVGALVALIVPAIASAAPALEQGGKLVPKGTRFLGVSTNMTAETSLGTFTCSKLTTSSEVTENTGSSVKAVSAGEGTTESCKVGGSPVKITDATWVSVGSTTPGKGLISQSFVGHAFGLTCTFTGTNTPFTYVSGTDVINVAGTLSVSGPFCPSSANFKGSFTLMLTSGIPIVLL